MENKQLLLADKHSLVALIEMYLHDLKQRNIAEYIRLCDWLKTFDIIK